MSRPLTPCLFVLALLVSLRTEATDRFFPDMEARSPSGQFVVTAKSPDNQSNGKRKAFQRDFTYICRDTESGRTLWTRNQTDTVTLYEEGSPCRVYVNDSGYTVIYTGWEELIVVGINGKETGKLNILRDCLTKEENDRYVSFTTAGPMWAGRSHWYFATADSEEYFIIRPWWGRHLVIQLTTASIMPSTEALRDAIQESEKSYVVSVLKSVLDDTNQECDCCGGSDEAVFASYLAGVLKIREAIPALRKLEGNPHIGSSSMGGFSGVPEGRIDPFNNSTYTTRQNVHLALRRLGEKPGSFPCTRFMTEHEDYDQMKPYVRKVVAGTRDSNAEKVRKGMSAEQVIDLIDCPDYIPSRAWQYDIDADTPYTLAITWTDDRAVEDVKVIRPALWQEGTVRDHEYW